MSADNGIYIGIFPKHGSDEKEYRVIHAQAIGNVEHEEYVRGYFENAPIFSDITLARWKAFQMEEEILADDFCPILEYGICTLPEFSKPLDQYPMQKMDVEDD